MSTTEAKELLSEIGIGEFNVMDYHEHVWPQLRNAQVKCFENRDYQKAELLCELENFLDSNGGEVESTLIEGGYFHIYIKK